MGTARSERRAAQTGSIICENHVARLRVIRSGATLGLALDALGIDDSYTSLQYSPKNSLGQDKNTTQPSLRFTTFDAVIINGTTRGVHLHGHFQRHPAVLTAVLDPQSAWCRILFSIDPGDDLSSCNIMHRWLLSPAWPDAEITWPNQALQGPELSANTAAFFQLGPLFSALLPDLDEGDYQRLALQSAVASGQLGLEFGIKANATSCEQHSGPLSFAYSICLDANAIPYFGYQQIVRRMGTHEALMLSTLEYTSGGHGTLSALPCVPLYQEWQPFVTEGTPLEIAALVHYLFSSASVGNWHRLEEGLSWLDRLCLRQRLHEVPGVIRFGSIATSQNDALVAQWMPVLLFFAFRLTGIAEYARRGIAATNALVSAERAVVLAHLREKFGDILLNADNGYSVLFSEVEAFMTEITTDGVNISIDAPTHNTPLTLKVEGAQDNYQLVVNDEYLGDLPTSILRAGVEIPLGALSDYPLG